jgi:hypothetical protein
MTHTHSIAQRLVEKALAYAHAALDETTPYRVAEARMYAAEVLPSVSRMKPRAIGLSEARALFELLGQLRAVMEVLERKVELRAQRASN